MLINNFTLANKWVLTTLALCVHSCLDKSEAYLDWLRINPASNLQVSNPKKWLSSPNLFKENWVSNSKTRLLLNWASVPNRSLSSTYTNKKYFYLTSFRYGNHNMKRITGLVKCDVLKIGYGSLTWYRFFWIMMANYGLFWYDRLIR